MVHIDPTIVHLTIDGETVETTPEHPFYVVDSAPWLATGETKGRWVDAGALQVGDAVRQADSTTGMVQAVVVVQRSQPMYNLTVAVAHTFFVGAQQWLVHNCGAQDVAKNLGLDPNTSPATQPYKRPSGSVTPEQRASVQGKPCVTCGAVTPNQVADHIGPLVVEHYRTGSIDLQNMRSPSAVQPQCPACSNSQGGTMSNLSRYMRKMMFSE